MRCLPIPLRSPSPLHCLPRLRRVHRRPWWLTRLLRLCRLHRLCPHHRPSARRFRSCLRRIRARRWMKSVATTNARPSAVMGRQPLFAASDVAVAMRPHRTIHLFVCSWTSLMKWPRQQDKILSALITDTVTDMATIMVMWGVMRRVRFLRVPSQPRPFHPVARPIRNRTVPFWRGARSLSHRSNRCKLRLIRKYSLRCILICQKLMILRNSNNSSRWLLNTIVSPKSRPSPSGQSNPNQVVADPRLQLQPPLPRPRP